MSSPGAEGTYLGYDPGGDGKHGVAVLRIAGGRPVEIDTHLLSTAESVIAFIGSAENVLLGIGIDTLTGWSTGSCGWRPADRWLRKQYPEVRNSVASANSLYGAMAVNGMSVLIALRDRFPNLFVTETHPKVLHWHLRRERYDYVNAAPQMNQVLADQVGISIAPKSDHEWDAAISSIAAYLGGSGQWSHDLHSLPVEEAERLVFPCGPTQYAWPE
jgi:hypothetical protein